MNRLKGTIVAVASTGSMSFVELAVGCDTFSAFVLETPQTCAYLQPGCTVFLLFKETEVSLAKNLSGLLSIGNRFTAVVRSVNAGAVLTEVAADYGEVTLRSIISSRAALPFDLRPGEEVLMLVKSNEITLMEA